MSEPAEPLAARPLSDPHPDRLSVSRPDYDAILQAHTAALQSGADTYVDPSTGFIVLTAAFLARRGCCCESGCRHCPYLV